MLSSIAELCPLLPCGPVGTYIWCGLEQTSVEQTLIATAFALVVPKSISALNPLLQASVGPRCSSMSHTLHSPREICLFWQPPQHWNIQAIPGTSWQLLVGTAATLIEVCDPSAPLRCLAWLPSLTSCWMYPLLQSACWIKATFVITCHRLRCLAAQTLFSQRLKR